LSAAGIKHESIIDRDDVMLHSAALKVQELRAADASLPQQDQQAESPRLAVAGGKVRVVELLPKIAGAKIVKDRLQFSCAPRVADRQLRIAARDHVVRPPGIR